MKEYTDHCFEKLSTLVEWVELEHVEQIRKWDIQTRTAFEWLTYLSEEVGELAHAISEHEYRDGRARDVFKEAIQVATLALKIAEMFWCVSQERLKNYQGGHAEMEQRP